MAIDASQLLVRVGANTKPAEDQLQTFNSEAVRLLGDISGKLDGLGSGGARRGDGIFGSLLKVDILHEAIQALTSFGQTALESYATNERLSASLDTLVARELRQRDASLSMSEALAQAGPKAQELLQWNQQLAINSPFTEQGVAAAFRMVQAYGFVSESADKTAITAKRLTQDIIDFAAGSGRNEEAANRIALALGQIQAKGRVAGQEVLQLTENGVEVDRILAEAFNKSTAEIVAMREQGLIPADAAIRAIVESLERDFGGAAQRQAGTMTGLINSLQDLYAIGSRDVLGPTFEAALPYVQELVTTLQSPEAKQQMQEVGEALGMIARDHLPVIIRDMQSFVGYTKNVYDVIKPVVDAYHEIQNIKLPGGEVGDIIGLGPIKEFATGGLYRDVLGFYNDLTGATAEAAAAQEQATEALAVQQAFAQLMANDSGGWRQGIEQTTAAQEQQNLVLQTSTAELEKYQTQLDKIGTQGADAYTRLQDAQTTFQQQEQQRTADHQRRLVGIAEEADRKRLDATQQYQERTADATQQYQDKLADLQRTAAQRTADADQREQDRATQAAEQLGQKLEDIQQRQNDRTEQYRQQHRDLVEQHQERVVDITRDGAERAADADRQALDQRTQAAEQYASRAAELTRQLADVQEQAAQAEEDRQRDLRDHMDDIQEQAADRLADVQQQATDRAADNQERYDEDRRQKSEDHEDRLSDLRERWSLATSESQREALSRQIDQENERYAKQEQRATLAFARQQQQAQEQVARQQQEIQEQAAREEAKAREQAEREEAKAQEQLARQQARIAQEQAQLDLAYQQEETRRQQEYEREQTQRDAALAQQLAAEQAAFAQSNAAARQKYEADSAQLAQQAADEQQSYAAREARAAEHYQREKTERDAALAQEIADAAQHYQRAQEELTTHYTQKQAAQAEELARRIEAENTNYAATEERARQSYAQQEQDLREGLGKQLAAYVEVQQDMTAITAEEATRRRAIIAAEFGFDPAQERQQFGAILAQITGGGGNGASARSAGSNTSFGDVYITIPGAGDPQATAEATRRELIRTGRRNNGLSGGLFGGLGDG